MQWEDIVKTIQVEFNAIKLIYRWSLFDHFQQVMRNHWYMNINDHFHDGFHSLGLICIQGNMNTAKAIRLVEQ